MKVRGLFMVCMLLTASLLAACISQPVESENIPVAGGAYRNIDATGLNTMLDDQDFVLVNVHTPFTGDIPGTDISIPYDRIEESLSQLPSDKGAKIVLYCRSGHMSQIAAEQLVSLGYTDIWNLKGGMMDWEQAGFDLEK